MRIIIGSAILALAVVIVVYFLPALFLNTMLKEKLTNGIKAAYPAWTVHIASLRYNVLENLFVCDSITASDAGSNYSLFIGSISLTGIGRVGLLQRGRILLPLIKDLRADSRNITLTDLKLGYALSCESIDWSVPDSSLKFAHLAVRPDVSDDRFFAEEPSRRTLFDFSAVQGRLEGADVSGIFSGKGCRIRSVSASDPALSFLVDKEKLLDENRKPPRLPGVILSSIAFPLRVDTLVLENMRFAYHEKFAASSKPARLWWDSIRVVAVELGNLKGGVLSSTIEARGRFFSAAPMGINVKIPLDSPGLSFRYSGYLESMSLDKLNSYIEIAEHKRIKNGVSYHASFAIDVKQGRAAGTVRARYKDLKIVAINSQTGSESGVINSIISFLANNIKLRTTNLPDGSGSSRTGEVKYTMQKNDTFVYFMWVALRSGLHDLVRF
jgi:hypothetical protein